MKTKHFVCVRTVKDKDAGGARYLRLHLTRKSSQNNFAKFASFRTHLKKAQY